MTKVTSVFEETANLNFFVTGPAVGDELMECEECLQKFAESFLWSHFKCSVCNECRYAAMLDYVSEPCSHFSGFLSYKGTPTKSTNSSPKLKPKK